MSEQLLNKIFEKLITMENDQKELKTELKEMKTGLIETKIDLKETKTEIKGMKVELKETNKLLDHIQATMVTKDYLDKVIIEQQKDVIAMLQHVDNKLDSHISLLREDLKSVAEVTGDHEMRIRSLARKPV
ncbi:MAG: hypothetical protein ACRDBM_12060 [Sporomusa sp.]